MQIMSAKLRLELHHKDYVMCIMHSPHVRISLQHGTDQTPCITPNLPLQKAILICKYPPISTLHILGFVRRLAHQHRKANNAHAPNIHLEGMSMLFFIAFNDLGGNVVGRAADGLALFVRGIDATGEAKVSHLDVHGFAQEQVAELQITVNDIAIVNEGCCLYPLHHEETSLLFSSSVIYLGMWLL